MMIDFVNCAIIQQPGLHNVNLTALHLFAICNNVDLGILQCVTLASLAPPIDEYKIEY